MWEPTNSLSVPVHDITLSHFWCPWVGQAQRRRILKIWFGSGSCDGLQPSLKLPSLVVPGGKWLPFSQVGGIATSEREHCWWCINGVPNNMIGMWLTQTKWFVSFLARVFAPNLNDWIRSFSSQPLMSCTWLPNWVT